MLYERRCLIIKSIKNIFIALLLLFCAVPSVKANESFDYVYTGVNEWGNNVGEDNTAIINLIDENGNIISTYCIDHETSIVDEHNYSIVNLDDASYIDDDITDVIRNIVINAYPFNSIEYVRGLIKTDSLTEKEAIASTQAAIWHYANGYDFELEGNEKILYDYYLNLESKDASSNISKLNMVTHTYFEEGIRNLLIKIDTLGVYDLEYTFNKDITLEYGIEIERVNEGVLLKNVPLNAEFEIIVNGKQNITKDVYFFSPSGEKNASQSLVGVSSGVINVSNSMKIDVVDNYYKITINKIDAVTKEGIPKVKFIISNTSDFSEYVFEEETNENGEIVLDNIPNGTWYIKELIAVDGYKINEDVISVLINDKDTYVDVENYPYGSALIIKENEHQEKLDNVNFDLYKDSVLSSNLVKKDIVTDENGEILIKNLDEGKYILVESKTKEGHILNNEEIVFDVEYGKTTEIIVMNETIGVGSLVISKLDSETEELLSGAEIGIYRDEECTQLYLDIITNGEKLNIDNLTPGRYCVKEIEAPEGYILNTNKYAVDVIKNEVVELEIFNYKIYNTASNHYLTFAGGFMSLFIFSIIFFGYNLCLKRK